LNKVILFKNFAHCQPNSVHRTQATVKGQETAQLTRNTGFHSVSNTLHANEWIQ